MTPPVHPVIRPDGAADCDFFSGGPKAKSVIAQFRRDQRQGREVATVDMPPKKKDDKKDDGTDADAGPDPALEQEKEIVTSELEIQGLTAKLARWQSRGKALAEENLALVTRLEEARRVMVERNDPLSRQLRSTHAATLEKESELLRAGEELERVRLEGAELERREAEDARARRAALEDELTAREATVKEVDDFASTRDTLDQELREKKLLLKASREDHLRRVDDVNTEFKLETATMRHEHTRKIKEAKAHMRALIDEQLAGTTKQTAAENERMEGEIAYQVRTTLQILDKNEALIAEHADMAREMDELHLKERELAESNAVHVRAIRTFVHALMERGEVDRVDAAAERVGDAVAAETFPAYALERSHTGALVTRERRLPRRRAGTTDGAEVVIARRVAEARFERERVGAAVLAAEAAEKNLATVAEDAARRAREQCERFLAACVKDVEGGDDAEGGGGVDGGGDDASRRRAIARGVLAKAIEHLDDDGPTLADVLRGTFLPPSTSSTAYRGIVPMGSDTETRRGHESRLERRNHRGFSGGIGPDDRRAARDNAELWARSGFNQQYTFTSTRRR